MTKNNYPSDPNANQEAASYKEPVPSREYIKQVITQSKELLKIKELIEVIGVLPKHQEGFKNRVKAMLRDGDIVQTKKKQYKIANTLPTLKGKVVGHPGGYGFIISSETKEKLFCSAREMNKVIHGDDVLVKVVSQSKAGKAEVIIDQVLQHNTHSVVGKIYTEGNVTFLRPLNKKQPDVVIINPPKKQTSDYVCVDITHQPTLKSAPMGEISEIINPSKAKNIDVLLAIKSYQLPYEWSKAHLKHTKTYRKRISQPECEDEIKQGRKDLRALPFCTIDGKDAKDFDDAVYCESLADESWKLIVSIADVSHYIKPNDPLDQEAQKRGNSVYFPGTVIPMLPEELSNGLCSLNPKVSRFCLSCEMIIDKNGNIKSTHFYTSIIKSNARLTYKKVNTLLKNKNHKNWQELPNKLKKSLLNLNTLYAIQKKSRQTRGAIDIETNNIEFSISAKGKIKKIKLQKRKLSHCLIEECMLMANVCAARFLQQHNKTFLYRIHDQPKPEKIQALRELLDDLDIKFSKNANLSTTELSKILKQAKKKPYKHIIQTAVLRSFKQAKYSLENIGHFGLNYPSYTHFTSPIRRYPDLLVHRAIKDTLKPQQENHTEGKIAQMKQLADHLSQTERRADEATREVAERLKCEYASRHINDTFEGTISSVVSFGLFVDLDTIYTEGLLHISSLGKEYFVYDEIHHRLIGENSQKSYTVGERICVRISRVSIEDRRIYLEKTTSNSDNPNKQKT
jgi:ribonuclease R